MKPLTDYIRSIPDFPKPGVIFRDLTPLVENARGFRSAIDVLKEGIKKFGSFDKIVAPEARGFLFAAPLALEFNVGAVLARKPGKLPYETVGIDYELEYGVNRIEIHKDSIAQGERVLIVDDLLATGGTVDACRQLVEKMGASVVGAAFVVELVDLKGRERLANLPVFAPVSFKGE